MLESDQLLLINYCTLQMKSYDLSLMLLLQGHNSNNCQTFSTNTVKHVLLCNELILLFLLF